MIQIGIPPRRIDLMTAVTGLDFEEAWEDRAVHQVGRWDVPFLGRASLIKNKRAVDRPKDRVDLALLGEGAPE